MSLTDALETFAITVAGILMILAAFAWAGFDAYSHAGRVGPTTLFGALVVGSAGGVLVSKHKMAELYEFLFVQATRARAIKFPSAGSDDTK